jgi:glyoxylase-like metal-dependent hydrolase (beta-lactamase superfamily II)
MSENNIDILVHENGQFMVNSYLIVNKITKECFFIDPAEELNPMLNKVERDGLKPVAILCTHGHMDHVEGVRSIKKRWEVPFYLNEKDWSLLPDVNAEEARAKGIPVLLPPPPDMKLPSEGTLELAGISITLLPTPGHTKGSVSFLVGKVLFSGDTLMSLSIGRTDTPGSDHEELIDTIRDIFFVLPEDTQVLPGHGPFTTIEQEKKLNPFMKLENYR